MKPADSSIKRNSAANQAIIRYKCISCSQIISHNKGYTDGKGKPIPLDETGKNRHDCLVENHQPIISIVVQDDKACGCTNLTPDDDDGWGYWFTDDEGRKLEGRA